MRIYDGSPRQDFEEVFRSIGAFLDARGMRDILMLEVSDGFVVQGLVDRGRVVRRVVGHDRDGVQGDADLPRRRHREVHGGGGRPPRTGHADGPGAGVHERALRVIGRWMDEQKPRDVFLFEQDGAYVVRLHVAGQAGSHHMLAEFTQDDINALVSQGPTLRVAGQGSPSGQAARPPPRRPRRSRPRPRRRRPGRSATPNGGNPGWGDPTG